MPKAPAADEVVDRPAGTDGFRAFVAATEPRLRRALVAAYGVDRGRDATWDALAYAWEHWERLRSVDNLVGYLYRVGQSSLRSPRTRPVYARPEQQEPAVEPGLSRALADLPERQRVAVILVHGAGLTVREAAEVLAVTASTLQRHLERGLERLRAAIIEGTR
jgi:RNA polymerase sigma factor (sigma-70 family)